MTFWVISVGQQGRVDILRHHTFITELDTGAFCSIMAYCTSTKVYTHVSIYVGLVICADKCRQMHTNKSVPLCFGFIWGNHRTLDIIFTQIN